MHKALLGEGDSSFFSNWWGDSYEIANIHWQNLKIFFSRATVPILTKLGTKHPCQQSAVALSLPVLMTYVVSGIQTPNRLLVGWTILPTAPPLLLIKLQYTIKARSHWPMNTKHNAKGHSGRPKFGGWVSEAAHVSWEEAKRKQKGYCRRLANYNGHGDTDHLLLVYVADWNRQKVRPFKRFCAVQNFLQ